MSTFDSTKFPLPQILAEITHGKIQLPDFQRGWIWDDDHVRSLLVSIARSFPVGAVMMLEAGGDIRLQVRPIENVSFLTSAPEPERLILDGQQRLTSLTQVLSVDKPVRTFNHKRSRIDRRYYIDIAMALESCVKFLLQKHISVVAAPGNIARGCSGHRHMLLRPTAAHRSTSLRSMLKHSVKSWHLMSPP